MDLDIVLEILLYLHPLELLQISRTSKAFHELLRFPITDLTWRNSFVVEDLRRVLTQGIANRVWVI
ncbi:hypothetical protein C8J57DRAFT_1372589 [Mycena rebaudengoi]|nr:hypothetical protein C8J57DRAFT_1372589 [Mycena rebaudengoi]